MRPLRRPRSRGATALRRPAGRSRCRRSAPEGPSARSCADAGNPRTFPEAGRSSGRTARGSVRSAARLRCSSPPPWSPGPRPPPVCPTRPHPPTASTVFRWRWSDSCCPASSTGGCGARGRSPPPLRRRGRRRTGRRGPRGSSACDRPSSPSRRPPHRRAPR